MSAVMSPCGHYRYRLDRQISLVGTWPIAFCLHNPSTADATNDDPTLRRAIGFAKGWDATSLTFVNVWAGRATRPPDLWEMDDPTGPENEGYIARIAREIAEAGGFMVLAWGRATPPAPRRAEVSAWLAHIGSVVRDAGCRTFTLGSNQDGSPKHPLYVRKDAALMPWAYAHKASP